MDFRPAPHFCLAFHSGGEQLFGYLESGKEPQGRSLFSLTVESRHFLYLLRLGAAERCWSRPWKGKVLQKEERMGPSFLERVEQGGLWLFRTSWNTTHQILGMTSDWLEDGTPPRNDVLLGFLKL